MRAPLAITTAALMALTIFGAPDLASAHVTVASGPGYAGTTQEITFQIAHGCSSGASTVDTTAITIDIPSDVTTLRVVPTTFGNAVVTRNGAQPTSVTWTKAAAALPADDDFYKVTIRIAVPNNPFTTEYFVAHQQCGNLTVDWIATAATPAEDAGTAEPAPALNILPAHQAGWNKYTVPVAVPAAQIAKLFADAQIVWKGTAAWSPNPNTTAQITSTSGVTALGDLAAGDEIWVKY